MEELKQRLEDLKDNFKNKIADIMRNEKDVNEFNDSYDDITRQYLRKIESILEDYGLDCKGNAIEYFRDELMDQKKRFTEKPIYVNSDTLEKAAKLSADYGFKINSELIEGEKPKDEKQETMKRCFTYISQKMAEMCSALKRENGKSRNGLEDHCNEIFNGLKRYVIKYRTKDLDEKGYDKESDQVIDKFYDIKSSFTRLTNDFTQEYNSALDSYIDRLYQRYLDEEYRYQSEVDGLNNTQTKEENNKKLEDEFR